VATDEPASSAGSLGPHDDDLVALSTDTSTVGLLAGYRRGRFPLMVVPGVVGWFEPRWRALLVLDGERSLRHVLHRTVLRRLDHWEVHVDTAFAAVVAAAADPARPGAWIDATFRRFYAELFEQGLAHSIECWSGSRLLGGCFGILLGHCFIGESMVSLEADASKVAFLGLVVAARRAGVALIDGQWVTPHLQFLGFAPTPRERARPMLASALEAAPITLTRGPLGLTRATVRRELA
jgi:leucyl/phenylalanyl-tRNA--protein transferase